MSFTYAYPRAALTVDMIILSKDKKSILLIQRLKDPYKDMWALPGGFLDEDELLIDAANRELQEETSLSGIDLKQLYVADDLGRDPRHRTISVIFYGHNKMDRIAKAGDDAKKVQWFPIDELPKLAFDHQKVMMNFKQLILK